MQHRCGFTGVITWCFLLLLECLKVAGKVSIPHNVTDLHWHPATATWYGSPNGDGSDGGACGYGSLVDVRPLKARVGAVSPVLFKNGEGCGACYKVKCLDNTICSKRPVTIIVMDRSPPGPGVIGRTHFDLSGAAFGHMAVRGRSAQLRNRGELQVLYRRTPCKYPGKSIAFHVNVGSTAFWLSLLIEFEDGDGDIGSMHIREGTFEGTILSETNNVVNKKNTVCKRCDSQKLDAESDLHFSSELPLSSGRTVGRNDKGTKLMASV
ncbi:hypothetical protein V6N13_107849 [Hibiscus sabdariffa]|uniref:Expansin-like EG45 domain-containing protein n=1 Tax=Hibiscus sabdariffa TaxID=183260 RepID=A0ABR2SQF8_9ROSI